MSGPAPLRGHGPLALLALLVLAGCGDGDRPASDAASASASATPTPTSFGADLERDSERVRAARVAAERGEPVFAAALLREVGSSAPWSEVPGWIELAVELRGSPIRQRFLLEHTGPLVGFAATPDGMHVAGIADRGQVRVWSTADGTVTYRDLPGTDGQFHDIDISPDGARVVAGGGSVGGSERGTPVWLWSAQSLVGELRGHTAAVSGLAFRPDGDAIATGSDDGTARVWDGETGTPLAVFRAPGIDTKIGRLAWRPDGQRLATGDSTGAIHEWAVGRDEPVATMRGHGANITALGYSPDGARLASGAEDRTVREWIVATGTASHVFTIENTATDVAFRPDGLVIAALQPGKEVSVLSGVVAVETKADGPSGPVAFAWGPDGSLVTTGKGLGYVRVGIDAAEARKYGHTGDVFAIRVATGGQVLIASRYGSVHVTQLNQGTRTATPRLPYARAYSPACVRTLVGGHEGERVGELEGKRALWSLPLTDVSAVTYAEDGATLALATDQRELLIVRSGTGEVLRRWTDEEGEWIAGATELALRSDGTLASASPLGVVVWGPDGRKRATLTADRVGSDPTSAYGSMAWSPDGAQLAIATNLPALLLWRVDAAAPHLDVEIGAARVLHDPSRSVAWSPDGARVTIAMAGGRVFEVDLASRQVRGRWRMGPIDDLRYAADGERLVVLGLDGTESTLPAVADPATILADLWQIDPACPSQAERRRWQQLDVQTASDDLARCEKIVACVVAGTAPDVCLKREHGLRPRASGS